MPGGYGWVFPKGDHLNLGVGGWAAQGPLLRDHLATLCDRNGVAADDLSALRGHRLPMRRSWGTTARGRAAVVGDAAGLVDPLSGDGMFEAILSSKLASESALDVLAGRAPGMEPYAHRLRRALAGHAATAWAAKAMLERAPALTWQVLRTPMMRWFVASRLRNADAAPAPRQRRARALGPPGPGGRGPLGGSARPRDRLTASRQAREVSAADT